MAAPKPYWVTLPPASLTVSFLASSAISSRLVGGFAGSSPARSNASLFMYSSGVEELNGIECSLPSTE